jgi:hypothetical protein
MSLQVFVDHLSQPSRAVLIVLKMLNVPFEVKETRISKMENRTPEFVKISPTKKGFLFLLNNINSSCHIRRRFRSE